MNPLFQQYNYRSLITEDDDRQACGIIKNIVDSGNYFKNSPPFQTQENLFGRPESVWLKYRMSFLTSVFLYLGKEHRVANMMAWSFMTNVDTQEDRERYWHHHAKHNGPSISGIYYLRIPSDADWATSGTELAPQGPEHQQRAWMTPAVGTWFIYDSSVWHRPGILTSKDYRFVLAVDVEYTP
jgi:predicted 3-demethylubiquinone-9 3-methyltransferase (glyoxalase superfamily)